MAGHSKWSNIKHKKAREDAKRAKIFTKLVREIIVAAREGGGDPDYNARLRLGIERAKDANMPNDNIENAIKKGTGELEGVDYEEYTYEGYGPAGTAFFIEAVSDNKNRTVSEMRHLFDKHGGNLGADGCVAWQFERRGLILVDIGSVDDADTFQLEMIECGATDFERGEDDEGHDVWKVYSTYESFNEVNDAIRESGNEVSDSMLTRIPTNEVDIDSEDDAEKVLDFYGLIDDHDDVQNVYANFSVADDLLERISG